MDNNQLQELRERTNPVFNTAKATLINISNSGDKDAELLLEKLNIKPDSISNGNNQAFMFGKANNLIMELRYGTMNNLLKAIDKDTIVDLPSGYTPRSFKEIFRNKHYIGCDLPVVIDELTPAVTEILEEHNITGKEFYGVDATNYKSLRRAFDTVKGDVCITTEGLLMYFNHSELVEILSNIRNILNEFGGCWVTFDPESSPLSHTLMKIILGEEGLKAIFGARDAFSKTSDLNVDSNEIIINGFDYENGIKSATKFLNSHGFNVERIPIANYMPELKTIEDLPEESKAKINELLEKMCIWVLTADENYSEEVDSFSDKDFEVTGKIHNGEVMITVAGRIDSISSPEFLAFYEKIIEKEKPERIIIEASDLDYISSAGIRVLFMMLKRVGNGNLSVTGQNETVKSILYQTGITELLG